MAKTTSPASYRVSKTSAGTPQRQDISNEILLSLPRKELDIILPELDSIDLMTHEVLNETGLPIQNCYFPNSGLASIVNLQSDGKSVEVGVTGKEGFVGLPLVVGFSSSSTRALVQVAGTAVRLSAAALERLLPNCPHLEKALNRYSQLLGVQSTQIAACNRLHEVDERLARWLLMTQDRLGGDIVPLTQEFLSHMLGTRRASVTVAAGVLQKAGLIQYRRGAVTIVNRAKLEAASCECYQLIVRQVRSWQNEMART